MTGTNLTPYEKVISEFTLPFPLYPFQVETVNELAPLPRAGYWLDPGCGKTSTSTASCLFKRQQVVVLAPPILGKLWQRFLQSIPEITMLHYAGSPKDRKEMDLNVDFIVMSVQIFKKDYDYLLEHLDQRLTINIDECTSVKGIESDNHKAVVDVMRKKDVHLLLLSGTPLSKVEDAYAYAKLLNTGAYRNYRHFMNVHVEEYDFFGNPTKFRNLELLHENMKINSVRILKEDVLKYLPELILTPLPYSLDPQHQRLYNKLAEEQLLELENTGGKIDATEASKLYHALGQIVVNWGHFADDPDKVSKALDVVEEILSELGDGKLIVFSNYRLTNRLLMEKLAKYNPVAIYGGIGAKEQQRSIDTFVEDPSCRVVVAQFLSGGVGIDNWQHVCCTVLFLEIPTVPAQFTQALSRVHRNGQTKPVTVYLATAEGTVQVRQVKSLLDKDYLINRVVRNAQDLRDSLFGVDKINNSSQYDCTATNRGIDHERQVSSHVIG